MLINEGFGVNSAGPLATFVTAGHPLPPCRGHIAALLLDGPGLGQGERLEPRIVYRPDRHGVGRCRNGRRRMHRCEQRDICASAGRAAVQDHVRPHQRGAEHRSLHGIFRPASAARRPGNCRCFSPAGSADRRAARRAGSTECGTNKPGTSGTDRGIGEPTQPASGHHGQPRPTTARRSASAGAGRAAAGASAASARAGRSHRLRYPLQRADHRSLHRAVWPPRQPMSCLGNFTPS